MENSNASDCDDIAVDEEDLEALLNLGEHQNGEMVQKYKRRVYRREKKIIKAKDHRDYLIRRRFMRMFSRL